MTKKTERKLRTSFAFPRNAGQQLKIFSGSVLYFFFLLNSGGHKRQMEADSLLMGGPRIKFECLRDDVSFPALSEKHLHVLQLLSDVMHELEQAGGTPILPDSKVGGNCAFRLSEKHLLVSRSSKRPFARLRVPQDFVCVTNFDEEKWKCTFCSLEDDLLPSSDTPLLWHSSAQVVVHGHGLFEEQDAAALKCPISPQETLFSTRDDLDALRKMLPAKLCIRKGHGFFLMSTEEDLVKDLRPILDLLKSRQIRVFVHGFGGVGKILCDLLRKQATRSFLIVGVSDSKGFLFDRNGIDLDEVSRVKEEFGCVARNRSLLTNADILLGHVDIFFDARPFSFTDKNEVIISMLKSGTDVVFTNKAPCALMFDAHVAAAQHGRSEFRFSSCVGGALPSVNMLQRDLKGCRLRRIEAILNVSTNILLRQMERQGCTLEAAIADLSSRGLLETDPSMDVDAFDSAAKIAILGEEQGKVCWRLTQYEKET